MAHEEWRPVFGYEGLYEICRDGRVRTVTRKDTIGREIKQHLVASRIGRNGYPEIWARKDGKTKHLTIHRALLEAFVGPRLEGQQARHLDDDKLNYSLDNLAWGTRSENNHDRVRNGIHHYSKRDRCSRGHRLDEWNLSSDNSPKRRCKACAVSGARFRRDTPEFLERVNDLYLGYMERVGASDPDYKDS